MKWSEAMYDIIIIGAGTAGLSAAIYGVRAGKKTLVLDGAFYGGQIVNTQAVENYPGISNVSGFDFVYGLYTQATELGAEYKNEKVIGINRLEEGMEVVTETGKYMSKTIILAMGGNNKKLGVAREEELTGRGVSYCATCDGAFYKGKTVAVVGGGNTAVDDAIVLSAYCNRVYLIHRRDTFRAEEALVARAKEKDNIEFILNSTVSELHGEDRLSGVTVDNMNTGDKTKFELDGIFVAVGVQPAGDIVSNLVEMDSNGYIVADESCKTSVPGIFVAGDIRTKEVRQLVTAAADGAVAALAASSYIDERRI